MIFLITPNILVGPLNESFRYGKYSKIVPFQSFVTDTSCIDITAKKN